MKNWTIEGHLTDLALQLHAADEIEPAEVGRVRQHLGRCAVCRARVGEWRDLFQRIATLPTPEPSPEFDDRVMARVRLPAAASASVPAWFSRAATVFRRIAVGAAALWSAGVIGGGAWLVIRLESPIHTAGQFLRMGADLVWAAAIKVGAALEVSGVIRAWNQAAETVPGPSVLSALALMTAVSMLALWTLYRVAGRKPTRINAHA